MIHRLWRLERLTNNVTASHEATHIILRPYLRLAGPLFRHTLCEMSLPHSLGHRSRTRRRCTECRGEKENYYHCHGKETIRQPTQKRGDKTMPARRLSHLTAKQRFLNKKTQTYKVPLLPSVNVICLQLKRGPKLELSALFNGFQGSTSVRTTRLFSQSP